MNPAFLGLPLQTAFGVLSLLGGHPLSRPLCVGSTSGGSWARLGYAVAHAAGVAGLRPGLENTEKGECPGCPDVLPAWPTVGGDAVLEEGVVDRRGQILRTLQPNAWLLWQARSPRQAAHKRPECRRCRRARRGTQPRPGFTPWMISG